jgi:TRAP transporter TAXI family solute receptor
MIVLENHSTLRRECFEKHLKSRRSHMKQTVAFLGVCMLLIGLLAGCGDKKADPTKAPDKKVFINLATGGTAGVYYPLGVAMADSLNKSIPGMSASSQSTGASVANVNLIREGKVELALIQNDIAFYAVNGTEMFKDKRVSNMKGVATLYNETIQIVTLADANIKTVMDLKGKRVAVGALRSGTEANARQILEVFGLTYADIRPQYLSFSEAANGLKDGNVDAAFVTAGAPTAAIQDIAAQHKIALLPFSAEMSDALIKRYPFYAKQTVKRNTYPGVTADVNTVAVKAMLVISNKVDDAMAYSMTKAIYSNLDRMKVSHALGADIQKATALEGMPIPVHAGADKFFKEK